MPISYRSEESVILVEAVGAYTPAELRAAIDAALAAAEGSAEPLLLFDLSQSSSLAGRSSQEVRHMAAFLGSLRGRIGPRVAMVISDDVQYGLMRMGSIYLEFDDLTGEVFRDLETARRWLLGLDVSTD